VGCGCNKPQAPVHQGAHEPQQVGDPVAPTNPRMVEKPLSGPTQQFALISNGRRIGGPYGSKLEAEADRVRKGYVGQVRPA
jgi:hypothetical protein